MTGRLWSGRLAPVLVAGLALGAAGCASWVQEPEVRGVQVGLAQVGLAGATARVVLDVFNPNGFGLDAKVVEYTLAFLPAGSGVEEGDPVPDDAWRALASGLSRDGIRLAAEDSTQVTIDVPFEYRAIGEALDGLLRDGGLRYRFSGAFTVGTPIGDRRIPFDGTGLIRP